jgi:hypothetical protein
MQTATLPQKLQRKHILQKVPFTLFTEKIPLPGKKNYFNSQRNMKDSHILGRKHSMKEVCSQTQGRYICHECDVIMRVCNNI